MHMRTVRIQCGRPCRVCVTLSMYCSVKDIPMPSCRFHYYDCLVIPVASITNIFPWEKVGLLVEYESLGSALFPDGQRPASLRLRQWMVLKTVQDISATSLAKSSLCYYFVISPHTNFILCRCRFSFMQFSIVIPVHTHSFREYYC